MQHLIWIKVDRKFMSFISFGKLINFDSHSVGHFFLKFG
jgi:hypothetical protein